MGQAMALHDEAPAFGPEPTPLLDSWLGEGDILNAPGSVLGQQLQGLERGDLEDLAQELFTALKLQEHTLADARHAAARRVPASPNGPVGAARPQPNADAAAGGLRRNYSAAAAGASSPGLSPRGVVASSGGLQRGGRSGPVGGITNGGYPDGLAGGGYGGYTGYAGYVGGALAPEEALGYPRPARKVRSEAEAQQIFDGLYNRAKEQRIRRHTYAELQRLGEEVRLSQECPFEPRTNLKGNRSPRAP